MAKADQEIDALYQTPPGEFTAARNALAKTLSGDAARQVKALKKPTTVPWAVNQVFWTARPVYDRLMERGRSLRTAQIASLKGKKSDVRSAMEAHRKAVGEAVHRAQSLASDTGLNADTDQLARMFEALSLAATAPDHPGRFADVVEPQGFEALAGMSGMASAARAVPAAESAAEKRRSERAEEEARQRHKDAESRFKAARREVERAEERVSASRKALKQAESDLAAAQAEAEEAQSSLASTAATTRSHRD